MKEWPIEQVPIENIIPHPHNPKTHTDKQVEAINQSLEAFGNLAVCVWNRRTGHLLDGHARLEMWGLPTLECRVVDVPEEEETRILLTFDKVRELAEVNPIEIKFLLEEQTLLLEADPLLSLMYTHEDMVLQEEEQLSSTDDNQEADTEEDTPLDLDDIPTRTSQGEIWILGRHHLYVGNAFDLPPKFFGRNKAKITVTSPPYNVGENNIYEAGNTKKYLGEKEKDLLSAKGYVEFLHNTAELAFLHSELLFLNIQEVAGNKVPLHAFLGRFAVHLVNTMVWDKGYGQPAMEENILNSAYEFIFVYSKELNPHRHIFTGQPFRGTLSNLYRGKPQGKHEGSDIHKATFPLHLPMHLIENFSLEEDIIFDPFLGTGTTLLAAERLNRVCYGSELEPRFADLILSRWEAETGETAWCKEN